MGQSEAGQVPLPCHRSPLQEPGAPGPLKNPCPQPWPQTQRPRLNPGLHPCLAYPPQPLVPPLLLPPARPPRMECPAQMLTPAGPLVAGSLQPRVQRPVQAEARASVRSQVLAPERISWPQAPPPSLTSAPLPPGLRSAVVAPAPKKRPPAPALAPSACGLWTAASAPTGKLALSVRPGTSAWDSPHWRSGSSRRCGGGGRGGTPAAASGSRWLRRSRSPPPWRAGPAGRGRWPSRWQSWC
mmetsp:Transcript_85605/g.277262  ORF Transcript_85605/g.277262 Transcript_85605/m.277262 type:complete len:241 (-) Transcript_85605:915-1637(-)